jgi:ornithine carbamoyltransferase
MKNKDLISIDHLSKEEIDNILKLAAEFKKTKYSKADLAGKTLGLVFQKPSNRTRVSFSVGMYQLGGNTIYLSPEELQLGKREAVKDAARVLSRYLDVMAARTYSHEVLLELAKESTIPVINALTDLLHPCQGLSDIFTIKEVKGDFKGVNLSFVGDGNNVLHSLLFAASKVGLNLSVATPEGFGPDENIVSKAKKNAEASGSKILITNDAAEAVKGADFIYTDVWASMHQEDDLEQRRKLFAPFKVNEQLLAGAKKGCLVMHCLPAKRGLEITDEVLDGAQSIVYEQAENRLHTQKAILTLLLSADEKNKG